MALPGEEYSLGSKYNYPEQHCCSCGMDDFRMRVAHERAIDRRRRRRRVTRRRLHLV